MQQNDIPLAASVVTAVAEDGRMTTPPANERQWLPDGGKRRTRGKSGTRILTQGVEMALLTPWILTRR